MAIAAGLGIRNSAWARERRLQSLNVEELALTIHDTPNDPLAFIYYGGKLLREGQVEASERAFKRATDLDPKNAKAFIGLGSAQLRKDDLESALKSFEQAIKLDPKEPAAYLGKSQVVYQLGSPITAIEALKKIIELQPDNANAWYNLGKLHGEAHQSDQAYEALQQAVKLDPKRGDYWRHLGQVARRYSKLDEAEKALRKAIELNPKDPVAFLWLGGLYAQMGDTPKLRGYAEQALLSAISRDPTMADAYSELGQLYERRGNYDFAIANLQKAYEIDPSDDQNLYHLGMSLVKSGKKDEGQKMLKGAQALASAKRSIDNMENRIKANPRDRTLRLRIARLYRKYGNHDGAMNQYLVYQRMGAPDAAVEKETAAYRTELAKQGIVPVDIVQKALKGEAASQ